MSDRMESLYKTLLAALSRGGLVSLVETFKEHELPVFLDPSIELVRCDVITRDRDIRFADVVALIAEDMEPISDGPGLAVGQITSPPVLHGPPDGRRKDVEFRAKVVTSMGGAVMEWRQSRHRGLPIFFRVLKPRGTA